MKKLLWLSLASVGILLAACTNSGTSNSAASSSTDSATNTTGEKIVNLSENDDLLTLDTTQEEDFVSFNAQNQVLEGLYQLDENDQVIPAIASELPEISEDQMTYTIHLREDATWSNGEPVTAQDFLYAWRRAVTPETAPSYSSLFTASIVNAAEIVDGELASENLGVTAPDDYTLVVQLIKPISYFTSLLTFETFFPINQDFAEEQGESYGTSSATTLYNGPFTLTGWENNASEWSYVKNDDYWDAENVAVDQINISVIKSTSTAVNLYQTGELDRVILDGEFAAQLKSDSTYSTENDTKMGYLRFNQDTDKALSNQNFRKAIALAIDRKAYVENVLQDGSLAATGFLPSGFIFDPETNQDFRDVSGALQTFDETGAVVAWNQAKEELSDDNITITYLSSDSDSEKLAAQYIAGQLEQLLSGLTVEIVTVPSNNFQERYLDGDYDIAFGQWMPDYQDASTFLDMFQSTNGLNHIHYANPEYDALIDLAENADATNPEASFTDFVQAEQLLVGQDYAIAPIYQRQISILQNPDVTGIVKHAFGSPYSFKYIEVN